MKPRDEKKTLAQRIVEANVLGDGNLVSISPADVLVKSFEAYGNEETEEIQEDENQ
ncbi:MAG: hypothetical protein PWR27_1731 [Petroclostridium sp.]|uniref:hypothetical protein n=1 Tax=Petroclostridium xylanilyticum TaxID=1792311 RepID=UPI0012FF9E38|nr:hypothetical protein [Petroclostridium xylanilyticum]MBZ4646133.1 hypothetical protein [Clostridia bacterium]MDK2811022.1 hypothetical protein [Petroclostridium sp.]